MPFHQSFDPAELGPRERRERLPGAEAERRRGRRWAVGTGTFACPACDVPVSLGGELSLGVVVGCPYCDHSAPAREYLSLTDRPRPTRVRVMATIPPGSGVRV